MLGDALTRELISDLRLDYPPDTEDHLLSVLDRMERRATISARLTLLWLIVTGAAAAILIYAEHPLTAVAVFLTNNISVLISHHFNTQYDTVKGLHDWVLTNKTIGGYR